MHDLFPAGAAPAPGSVHERYVADRLAGVRDGRDAARRRPPARRGTPDGIAFVAGDDRLTWAQFDARSTAFARRLAGAGLPRGARVGVLLPDGVEVHVVYLAAMKAGMIVVAIGPRAARLEVRHLLTVGGATALVSQSQHRGEPVSALVEGLGIDVHLEIQASSRTASSRRSRTDELRRGEIHLLNSTSGTTGMPKCVVHNQNRWFYYHELAVECGDLRADDVFLTRDPRALRLRAVDRATSPRRCSAPRPSSCPASTPTRRCELIERERVTVLLLRQHAVHHDAQLAGRVRGATCRRCGCMFTGGEAVPFERAAEFERRTGAKVLQFFGSNETGALSRTTSPTPSSSACAPPGGSSTRCDVRLFDDDGTDVTAAGGPGQAACAGPATCLGYFDDPAANERAVHRGRLDAHRRHLHHRRRRLPAGGGPHVATSSSAAARTSAPPRSRTQVGTHPAVAMVAAVAVPDPTFGERVCAFVGAARPAATPRPRRPARAPARAGCLAGELARAAGDRADDLPRGSGGKIAKAELRQRLRA